MNLLDIPMDAETAKVLTEMSELYLSAPDTTKDRAAIAQDFLANIKNWTDGEKNNWC